MNTKHMCGKIFFLLLQSILGEIKFGSVLFITKTGEEFISKTFILPPYMETRECEINHSRMTIAAIKNAWNCISIPLYAFVNEYGKQSPSSLKHKYN
jgi:hypothetical protein